ncbi:MAG TPA: tetratricopeptide repeat protein [Chitinophagales bacterium]|nr:tetratricopeptide repeat protein [Chitinophagales bacterium]HPE97260.1 tetratricopeptide repeat protein [Chitinophagales bacterium]HRX23290.1 tetratricopeptide repeat protein [Chitinophagales bacterium]
MYHDLTARDNGYFNAKLLLSQSRQTLWDGQTEDFSALLPVYKFGDKESAQGEQSNLDEVIKKSSIVIQLHKKSKWVDDCYMLIGQANFYKKEYDEAITSFQYIISKYSDQGKRKKKKKKKSADEESWLKEHLSHHPVANEAALWVVLTLTEKGAYTEAKTALSVIKGNPKFPSQLDDELAAVEASLYLKQRQYGAAIKALQTAEELTKDKALKARYAFILSQLYADAGEFSLSQEGFQRVIKYKPDYVTDFYARLFTATQGMQQSGTASSAAVATLTAMLKEDKYKEFYPLIYNTLAEIELRSSNVEDAVNYLKEGIRTGDVNPAEKALSYVKLGDIYYEQTEYKPAYNQYDSALQTLDRAFARYKEIETRRDGLIDLVKALTTIETEKKLQYLASLNEFDLDKELDKMIAEQEAANQQEFLDGAAAGDDRNEGNTGEFYFYNATLLSRGFGEFKKVWGNRSLEDNWRRSDKRSFDEEAIGENENQDATEESEIDLNSEQLTKEDIIKSLPRTPELLEASNRRIAGALYAAGNIYRQKFENDNKAVEYFRENINDFPDNPFELQSLYQLFVIFDGQPAQDQYKSSILNKYPESLFANIIRDPDYLEKQLKQNEQLEDYYTTTYDFYTAGDLSTVRMRLTAADSLFPNNPLQPKFDMLEALSLSDTASIGTFAAALQSIVDKYPTDEVGIRAKAILDYINKTEAKEEAIDPSELYSYNSEEEHYVILVIPSKGKEATSIKNALADFNTTNYNVRKLRVSSLLFGPEQTLILIKTFTDASDAMDYFSFVENEYEEIFEDIDMNDTFFFVVSKSNYVQLYKSKEAETYIGFFEENYLTEE